MKVTQISRAISGQNNKEIHTLGQLKWAHKKIKHSNNKRLINGGSELVYLQNRDQLKISQKSAQEYGFFIPTLFWVLAHLLLIDFLQPAPVVFSKFLKSYYMAQTTYKQEH